MQNTYERILKYLIEHDVELTIKPKKHDLVQIILRQNNRYTHTNLTIWEYKEENQQYFFSAIADCLHRIFPSFKDFDTPIKL